MSKAIHLYSVGSKKSPDGRGFCVPGKESWSSAMQRIVCVSLTKHGAQKTAQMVAF